MKWYDDKYIDSSSLVLPPLYKVNDDIYDEITETSPGQYLYHKRCGITPYIEDHNFTNFITNGEYIIYELPISEQTETILTRDELSSYSDNNTTILYGSTNVDFDFELDRRYKEYRTDYTGKRFFAPTDNMNLLDDNYHRIKVYEIVADTDGVSELTLSGQTFQLPKTLNTGDRLVWQGANKSYIYYPADETQDFEYYSCECITTATLAESTNDTLYSVGEEPDTTYTEIIGNNEVSFTSTNDKPIESVLIGGATDVADESILPNGYTEVEYIASGEKQYINTGYHANFATTKVEAVFSIIANPTESYCGFFGSRDDTSNKGCFYLATSSTLNQHGAWIGNYNYPTTLQSQMFVLNQKYHVIMDKNSYIENDVVYNSEAAMKEQTGTATYDFVIAARDNKGTVANFANIKIYSFKIYENDALIKNYIPCINPSNVPGLYDIVNQEFLSSATSTNFTASDTIINRRKDIGLGGDLGQACNINIKHTYGTMSNNINVSLNTPLLPGETIDLFNGTVNRKFSTINSYNGETITTKWYSSTTTLSIGSVIAYQVADYTETTSTTNQITTNYDTHKFEMISASGAMQCPITINYDSTNYFDYRYKINFNSEDSRSINKITIVGSTDGAGTHVTDNGQDYYKLTLTVQDINNRDIRDSVEVILDNILYENDTFVVTGEILQELYTKITNISGTVFLYFEENVRVFSMEYVLNSNIDSNCQVLISIPYKEAREIDIPTVTVDMGVGSGDGFGQLSWDEVYGATEYQIVINDDVFTTVDNHVESSSVFKFDSEISGNMNIVALNDLGQKSQSSDKEILSVPNSTSMTDVDIMYETNKYKVSFNFDNNSNICDYYNLVYTVDDGTEKTIKIDNTYQYGEKVPYSFNETDIINNISMQLLPTNSTGSNNYTTAQNFITVDDFNAWTYKIDLKQILLCWYDMLEKESNYVIRYRINRGEWLDLLIDGIDGANNRMLEYIDMDESSIMDVCLTAVVDGKPQVFTKSIRISKALDTMLSPPINFTGERLQYGTLEFNWEDNGYGQAHTYMLQITDAISAKTYNIPIPFNETGKYKHIYSMDGYGYVTAKVKMQWELGESEYSKNVMVYNIEVSYDAPPMNRQEHINNQLKISWQYYNYVTNYVLYLTINGETQEIPTADFDYYFDMPSKEGVYSVSAKVKAIFIDGSETNISDSIEFNICQYSTNIISTIYTHAENEYFDYTTIYNKGIVALLQDFYTVSTVRAESMYDLYTKIYRQYLFTDYDMYTSTFGKGLTTESFIYSLMTSSYVLDFDYYTTVYGKIDVDNIIRTIIMRPSTVSYPIYSEFTKLIIACFGDSITAGHPNYWAETGTGDPTSQYEYWLSRRLKDEYDVVNKGYGQEKTDDMLDRFDRDIANLGAHYCIILGGTNDYVFTYIVRCSRKLCNVCL